ncbi:MAG TPA: CarD family transcriptional regulator [Caldilineaceae bacterium]|nr:CarD family transcriptional regulator [Caldilineaceae bacterium]
MGENSLLVVDDASELFATLAELEGQAGSLRQELERSGELPHEYAPSFFTVEEIRQRLLLQQPLLLGYGDLYGKSTTANTPLARSFVPGPRYAGKTKQVVSEIAHQRGEGHRTVLVTRQAARLQELLNEADLITHVYDELTQAPPPHSLTLVQGVVGEGFVMRGVEDRAASSQEADEATTLEPEARLANSNLYFYTDSELFGWSKPQARRRSQAHSSVAPEIFFADVKPGDYVVHLEHGIGQFDGLVKLEMGGILREYLQVSYARGDKLYVPVHQADRLSRYVGAGEKTPMISRLGTADWQLVKERARRAVAEIADDLLQLYAEREMVRRHVYSPDGPWQEEMEASFPFEETEDQLRAIEAIKKDMESDKPMDRLVVGDVGYGKTEVAVRAAFKGIVDGQQGAVLVPTTGLAQQHFRTISARFSRFPLAGPTRADHSWSGRREH